MPSIETRFLEYQIGVAGDFTGATTVPCTNDQANDPDFLTSTFPMGQSVAAGDFRIRQKAHDGHPASEWAYNTTAFDLPPDNYENGFETDVLGELPEDWINISPADFIVTNNSPVVGTKSLGESTSSDGHICLYAGKDIEDQRVTMKTKFNNGAPGAMPLLRDDGTGQNHYLLLANGTYLSIYKRESGNYAAINEAPHDLSDLVGKVVCFKMEAVGNTIKVKFWKDEDTEPTDYMVLATDASFSSGVQGMRLSNQTGSPVQMNGDEFKVENLSVAGIPELLVNDSKLYTSPANWRFSGTDYIEANSGAYVKCKFTGTSITVNLDPSQYASAASNQTPILLFIIDGVRTSITLANNQTTATVSGLSNTVHNVKIILNALYVFGDSWNANAIRITKITANVGASFQAPTVFAKKAIVDGDSISLAQQALSPGGTATATGSTIDSYAMVLADEIEAEIGIIAYGGLGWESTSAGGVPRFDQSWDKYKNGVSRLVSSKFSPIPDVVFCNHGTNGAVAAITVQNWLAAVRGTLNTTTQINIVLPFYANRTNVNANITQGVNDYITASGDSHVFIYDLGTTGENIVINNSFDAVHPKVAGHLQLGQLLATQYLANNP